MQWLSMLMTAVEEGGFTDSKLFMQSFGCCHHHSPFQTIYGCLQCRAEDKCLYKHSILPGISFPRHYSLTQSELILRDQLMELQKGQSSSHPTWGHGSQEPYSVVPGLPSPKPFSNCNICTCLNPSSVAALL